MVDIRDNLNLNNEQNTRLFRLGESPGGRGEPLDPNEAREQLLCELLMSTLPVSKAMSGSFPELLQGQLHQMRSVAGEPIGDLLENPYTKIHILARIKDHAKQSGVNADGEVEEDVFLVIYCAAIASALAFHNQRITEHEEKDLRKFFQIYADEEWVLKELRELFDRALRHIDSK